MVIYLKKIGTFFKYLLFLIVAVEIILQGLFLLKESFPLLRFKDKRLSLPYYQTKTWAKEYFEEFNNLENQLEQFVMWGRKAFKGKYININSEGLRKTWNPKFKSEETPYLIYLFGGSTVWGTGARDDFTIPSLISKKLNQLGYKITVENYGESGFISNQEIIRLNELLKKGHRPDIVIFYDGINDVYGAFQSGEAGKIQNYEQLKGIYESAQNGASIGFFLKELKIYKIITKFVIITGFSSNISELGRNLNKRQIEELSKEIRDNYFQNLENLDLLSQKFKFSYLSFWQPVSFLEKTLLKEEINSDQRIMDYKLRDLYLQTYRKVRNQKVTNFYDITKVLNNRRENTYIDFCHISEEGNMIIADNITQHLVEKLDPKSNSFNPH